MWMIFIMCLGGSLMWIAVVDIYHVCGWIVDMDCCG